MCLKFIFDQIYETIKSVEKLPMKVNFAFILDFPAISVLVIRWPIWIQISIGDYPVHDFTKILDWIEMKMWSEVSNENYEWISSMEGLTNSILLAV